MYLNIFNLCFDLHDFLPPHVTMNLIMSLQSALRLFSMGDGAIQAFIYNYSYYFSLIHPALIPFCHILRKREPRFNSPWIFYRNEGNLRRGRI